MSIDVAQLAAECTILLASADRPTAAMGGTDVLSRNLLRTISEVVADCAERRAIERMPHVAKRPRLCRYALSTSYHLHVDDVGDVDPRQAAALAARLFARAATGDMTHPDTDWPLSAVDLAGALAAVTPEAADFTARTPWSPARCPGMDPDDLAAWSMLAPATVVIGFSFATAQTVSVHALRGSRFAQDVSTASRMRHVSILGTARPRAACLNA